MFNYIVYIHCMYNTILPLNKRLLKESCPLSLERLSPLEVCTVIASSLLCKKTQDNIFRSSVSGVSLYPHLQCTDELWEEVLVYNDLSLSGRVGTKRNIRHITDHQLNTVWTVVLHTCAQTGGWGSYKRPIRVQHSTDRPSDGVAITDIDSIVWPQHLERFPGC